MKKIYVLAILICLSFQGIPGRAAMQQASTLAPVCGNGILETGEQCDGANLGGAVCTIWGYTGGILTCTPTCIFNLSGCTSGGGGSGGGGGGGGGSYTPPSTTTSVVFSGRAYPKSTVTLLKDASVAATTVADANADFQITLSGLSGGNYMFSLYGEDNKGNRSSLLTFPAGVTAGTTTRVGSIFITPTIAVDKSEVAKGENLVIFGQSAPASKISIVVNSDQEYYGQVDADAAGVYLYNFDTQPLELGTHTTKSKAAVNGQISGYGSAVAFAVGAKSVPVVGKLMRADLNNDKRVNLVDFSIAAYWYKRTLSSGFTVTEKERLNGDGKIDLVDFSIMAYHWTG